MTTRGESSSVACIRSVSSIRISKRDVYSDRYYREKDGDREREKRRDLLCKKFWCAPPSVSLRFLSALLIFDYHPLMRRFWVKDHLLLLLSPPSETLKSWSRSLREKFWISVGPFNQVWKQVFVPKRDDTPALCRPDSNRFLQLDKHIYIDSRVRWWIKPR